MRTQTNWQMQRERPTVRRAEESCAQPHTHKLIHLYVCVRVCALVLPLLLLFFLFISSLSDGNTVSDPEANRLDYSEFCQALVAIAMYKSVAERKRTDSGDAWDARCYCFLSAGSGRLMLVTALIGLFACLAG